MATKRLSVMKLKEILRLKLVRKFSHRKIAQTMGVSPGAVGSVMARARAQNLTTWARVRALTEPELEAALYRSADGAKGRPEPNPLWIHTERQKSRSVTLEVLHLEYLAEFPNGYGYTTFCNRYRGWLKKRSLSMRQVHRAAQKTFVDYSGMTVNVVDPRTGEPRKAEVFVGVLGASGLTFVEATWTQRLPDWTASHVRMCEFFGGVTEVWVPDQLRSAVSGPHRYEPDLNRTYAALAEHYGAIIIPARPRKPKDKAKAEAAVLNAQRWILARLRNETFFSLAALNERIATLLEALNERPMRDYGKQSRRQRYELIDQPALRALPQNRYVYGEWSKVRVGRDYHVVIDEHAYSVPYQLVGERVDLCVSAATIEVFRRGKRVAAHQRSALKGEKTTVPDHMPAAHRAHADVSPSHLIERAREVGHQTERLIMDILDTRRHPEHSFRACLGILALQKDYGAERLEVASTRAMLTGLRRCRQMETLLKNGLDRLGTQDLQPAEQPKIIEHGNVRGANYYC